LPIKLLNSSFETSLISIFSFVASSKYAPSSLNEIGLLAKSNISLSYPSIIILAPASAKSFFKIHDIFLSPQ
jgi:hypothetical protein